MIWSVFNLYLTSSKSHCPTRRISERMVGRKVSAAAAEVSDERVVKGLSPVSVGHYLLIGCEPVESKSNNLKS